MKRSILWPVSGVECALFFRNRGLGQTGHRPFRGSVKDPSEALVSGATVTLIQSETNAKRTAVTTTSGAFSFDSIR